MIGRTILHYRVVRKLGEGGMGVVYLAEDTKLARQVAIKFLPKSISTNSDERKRFAIEARAAAALSHPNIATIHAIEEADGESFIVMEYVDGIELKEKIARGPLSHEEAMKIVLQIAEGLQAAHKKEIVHRDIKSANIMLTGSGQIKIMDFGLAKMRGDARLTRIGTTVGTIGYMSPEQARGEEVDHRTDIWSLGVLMYEMFTGRLPFRSDYEQAVIYSILNETPEPMNGTAPQVESVVRKALAKNADERYQSAGDLVADLRRITEGGENTTPARRIPSAWIAAGIFGALALIAAYFLLPQSGKQGTSQIVQTIAVLPFRDLSPAKDQEYFSDGMAEELLNALARIPQLRVTSRTSSFSFRGANTDIKTIGAKLNVKHILEGSVQKAGNAIRITAQLIDVAMDAPMWSNSYDATLENIFAVQDSISRSVIEALEVTLLGKEVTVQKRKVDPKAYNMYLLGNHVRRLLGKENLEKAVGYYQQAIAIDSNYAAAWAGLSNLHSTQADHGYVSADEGYSKALMEVEKALAVDPNSAAAHSQMGWIKRGYKWDWKGADESYRRALELEPGNASIVTTAAVLAATMGRLDEAIELTRRSIEMNPLNTARYNNLGYETWFAGRLDEAKAAFKKVLELNPQYPGAHMSLGFVHLSAGNSDSAFAELKKEKEPDLQLCGLAIVYHAMGRSQDSDTALASLLEKFSDADAYQIAQVYAYRGQADSAFVWLEQAYQRRDGGLSEMKGDPLLRKLEKDSRYAAFMKKMGLPL